MGKPGGHLSNRIKELRAAHGKMTQQELAEAIGVTRQTVYAMERNKYSPSLAVAFRIARAFHTTVEDVFHYEE